MGAPATTDEHHLPEGFARVDDRLSNARFDLRYFTGDNFVGTRIEGYEAPICYLTRPTLDALERVAQAASRDGFSLLIFDGYRPARAVTHFARWAAAPGTSTKAAYYPELEKSDLFRLGYLAARSGHSRGSSVDLTLVDASSGLERDMGSPFDFFGRRSWVGAVDITAEQRANRALLADLMAREGFVGFEMEWWHFTLSGEPFPDTYFDFPIRSYPATS